MVYFRAATQGACTYMDDRRDARLPHGACYYDLCDDLEVVDIPGDHFSILRQVGHGKRGGPPRGRIRSLLLLRLAVVMLQGHNLSQ